jgi:TIR domain
MNHIFVSYSRDDAEWVEAVVARLAQHGIRTWVDRRDLPVSLPWIEEVEDAIEESLLFLLCDSPSSRTSAACAAELAQARLLEKPQVTVSVTRQVDDAVRAVRSRLAALPQTQAIQTELVVRARDWDRAGQPSGLLAGRRAQQRLRRGLVGRGPEKLAAAYLAASRRRSRRRLAVTLVGAFVVFVAVRTPSALREGEEERAESNMAAASLYAGFRNAITVAERDPYRGLESAADSGGNESALNAALISTMLESPVPDDAFEVGTGADRFAVHVVQDTVEVLDGSGDRWSRVAADSGTRSASASASAGVAIDSPPSPLTVSLGESGVVRVERDGVLERTAVVSARPTVALVSPNQRELAVAIGNTVEVVDLDTADVRLTLRGAPDPITDLAWSVDGARVWATAGTKVVSWSRSSTRVVLDEPSQSFHGLIPATDLQHAWLLARDGSLRKIALSTGEVVASITVDDVALFAVADPGAERAVVIGGSATWMVDLRDGAIASRVRLEDCDTRRPVWSLSGASFYVPCYRGPVVEVGSDGAEVRRIAVPGLGASAVAVQPESGALVVGTADGYTHLVSSDGELSPPLNDLSCGAAIRAVAVSPSALVPVGDGTGLGSCSYAGLRDGSSWQWNSYFDDVQANTALMATLGPDGAAFVLGYTDGSLVFHPTENLMPAVKDATLHGAVRDLLLLPNGELFAATQGGVLAQVPWCEDCVSNRRLAEVAQRRLDRARDLGLTDLDGERGDTAGSGRG